MLCSLVVLAVNVLPEDTRHVDKMTDTEDTAKNLAQDHSVTVTLESK